MHEDQRGLWADPTTSIATAFSAVCSNTVRDSGPAGDWGPVGDFDCRDFGEDMFSDAILALKSYRMRID